MCTFVYLFNSPYFPSNWNAALNPRSVPTDVADFLILASSFSVPEANGSILLRLSTLLSASIVCYVYTI
jgi:hypothetical protein